MVRVDEVTDLSVSRETDALLDDMLLRPCGVEGWTVCQTAPVKTRANYRACVHELLSLCCNL